MKTSVAVMASDAVNLKNMRADTGNLNTVIQTRFAGELPQLMSHDRHRLAGWIVPSALHFAPGLTCLLANVYMPETAQDKEIVLQPLSSTTRVQKNQLRIFCEKLKHCFVELGGLLNLDYVAGVIDYRHLRTRNRGVKSLCV